MADTVSQAFEKAVSIGQPAIAERAALMKKQIDGLHATDRNAVLVEAGLIEVKQKFVHDVARYRLMAALNGPSPSPKMVEVGMQLGQGEDAKEWAPDISITPYEIQDKSLRSIVLGCPDETLLEIVDALRARATEKPKALPYLVRLKLLEFGSALASALLTPVRGKTVTDLFEFALARQKPDGE